MTRYLIYSILIHFIILFWYSQSFNEKREPGASANDTVKTNATKKDNFDEKIKKLIEKDIEEKNRKQNEVYEVVKKHKPTLENKKLENFADIIISSKLDEGDLEKITKDNLASRLNHNGNKSEDALKEDLNKYLETAKSDGKNSGQGGASGAGGNSAADGLGQGSGNGPLNFGQIRYEGHEISHNMKEHAVSSVEDKELESRPLEELGISEAITVSSRIQKLYEQMDQKPAKFAILPEEPFETTDTLSQSQSTDFRSLRIGFAPRMNDKFVPDGNLDEWDLSQPMVAINEGKYGRLSAKIYLSWDFDNIYLAADITDPNEIINRSGEWWTSNSLEVWFDILNNKLYQQFDNDDFQFWFAPYSPYFGKALGSHKFLSRRIPKAVKITEGGYIVEAAFRQNEELRYLRSFLGKTIGFHFFVNTSKRARDGYEQRLFWVTDKYLPGDVHTYTWNNPNSWGDVIFMGSKAKLYLSNKEHNVEYSHFGMNEMNWIVVKDGDRNLDPKTKQMVKVFLHGKNGNDIEELTLTETEVNSGKFAGPILSTSSAASQGDGILQTSSGEPVEINYFDQYTPSGYSHLIKKKVYTYYPVMVIN